jgi:hypothetical protein
MRLLVRLLCVSTIVITLQSCGGGGTPASPWSSLQPAKYANWSTVDRVAIGKAPLTLVGSGASVYTIDEWDGLSAANVSDLSKVSVTNILPPSSVNGYVDLFMGVSVAGNVACVLLKPATLNEMVPIIHLYDLSAKNNPTQLSTIQVNPITVLADGRYLYVSNGSFSAYQLTIIDIADPSQPKTLGSVAIQNPGKLAKQGNKIYISQLRIEGYDDNNYKCIQIVDVSDPSAPTLIASPGSSWSNATYSDLVVNGNAAYTYDNQHGLYVLDISQNTIVPIGAIPQTDNINTIAMYGSYLYVATDSALQVYSIANPTLPILVKTIPSATPVRFVSVTAGRGIYISDASTLNGPSQLNVFYLSQ